MLKLLLALVFGVLACDIIQSGAFKKSHSYKCLNDVGAIEYGEVVLKEAKKFLNPVTVWAEKNIPVYYNETCVFLKPYLDLSYDLSLVFKSNTASLMHHMTVYFNKNFPAFQNSVHVMLEDTVTFAKEGVGIISSHLQNYTEQALQYANNMMGS